MSHGFNRTTRTKSMTVKEENSKVSRLLVSVLTFTLGDGRPMDKLTEIKTTSRPWFTLRNYKGLEITSVGAQHSERRGESNYGVAVHQEVKLQRRVGRRSACNRSRAGLRGSRAPNECVKKGVTYIINDMGWYRDWSVDPTNYRKQSQQQDEE